MENTDKASGQLEILQVFIKSWNLKITYCLVDPRLRKVPTYEWPIIFRKLSASRESWKTHKNTMINSSSFSVWGGQNMASIYISLALANKENDLNSKSW